MPVDYEQDDRDIVMRTQACSAEATFFTASNPVRMTPRRVTEIECAEPGLFMRMTMVAASGAVVLVVVKDRDDKDMEACAARPVFWSNAIGGTAGTAIDASDSKSFQIIPNETYQLGLTALVEIGLRQILATQAFVFAPFKR